MKEEVEPAIAFCEVLRQQRFPWLDPQRFRAKSRITGKYIYDLENGNEEPLKTTQTSCWIGFFNFGFLKNYDAEFMDLTKSMTS